MSDYLLGRNRFRREITPAGQTRQGGSFHSLITEFFRDFRRVTHLVRLDLSQQVYGLSFGHFWVLLEPALMALTYYFIVVLIFTTNQSEATFAKFLVAIIFWRSHAVLTSTAPAFLLAKGQQYVEQGVGLKVAFLEFLTQEIFLFVVRYLVLLAFLWLAGYPPRMSWIAGLAIAAAMFCFTAMVSTWLAIGGVYFKDLGRLVGNFVWLWWYLSPGLYSFGQVPEWARALLIINPFSYILPAAHEALLSSESHHPVGLGMATITVASAILLLVGWRLMEVVAYAAPRRV